MVDGHKTLAEDNLQEAFAEHFSKKVEKIVRETGLDSMVYNGTRLFDMEDKDFMTKIQIPGILKNLKLCCKALKLQDV